MAIASNHRDHGAVANLWPWEEAGSSASAFTGLRSMSTAGHIRPRTLEEYTAERRRAQSDLGLYDRTSNATAGSASNPLHSSRVTFPTLQNHTSDNTTILRDPEKLQQNMEWMSELDVPQMCSICKKRVFSSEMVVIFEGEVIHLQCFCCGKCGEVVDVVQDFLLQEDNSPLCLKCSPVCHACTNKIVTEHVGVLNKDFHEPCLKCYKCHKVLLYSTAQFSMVC